MTTALTTTAPGWAAALSPATTEDAWKVAQSLAKSQFVPKAFANNPSDILIAGAMGARLGLDIFSALQSLAVVNGKPTLYGDALLAVCQSRPDWRGMTTAWSGEGDTLAVQVTVRRLLAGGEIDATEGRYSTAEAKKAGLWTKQGPWSQFPRRMLELRARAYALRGAFADALLGFHAKEEMEDAIEVEAVVHAPEGKRRIRQVAPAFGGAPAVVDPLGPAEQAQAEIIAAKDLAASEKSPAAVEPSTAPQPTSTADAAAEPAQGTVAAGEPTTPKPLPSAPEQELVAAFPTLDSVRAAVNYAASHVEGGAKAVVAKLAEGLGYPIATAASIKPEDRAKAKKIADDLAGVQP